MSTHTQAQATQPEPAAREENNPEVRKPFGHLSVAIWRKTTDDENRIWFEYTIRRSYRDEKEASGWGHTFSLRPTDTGDDILAALWAHQWIRTQGKQLADEYSVARGSAVTGNEDIPF